MIEQRCRRGDLRPDGLGSNGPTFGRPMWFEAECGDGEHGATVKKMMVYSLDSTVHPEER